MKNVEGGTKQSRFWGETTAFLALFLDNAGVLIFLNAILVFTFNFPVDIILTRMIPGTAIGVLIGDLIYTWLAIRLKRKTGRADVTAMPLGLDTPSTIGIAYAVLGPAYVITRDAQLTWQIGMATLFISALGLTLFGVIHSIMPTGELYLPWRVASDAHYMLALAYLALSGILLILTGTMDKEKGR
ncbi:MAG: hypothetical protein Q8O28_02145 [Smithellaceae bacterium]|nr:hypothetical protein [Smithellaceae bacterium]